GPLEGGAAIEGAGQEEDTPVSPDVGALPDDVDDARAVGPDRATLAPVGLGIIGGGAELALAPGAPTVGGGVDDQRLGQEVAATEGDVADVDVAEEGTRGLVVGPDDFIVSK